MIAETEAKKYYLGLTVAKVLKVSGKSKYVYLMSDGCIKKRYDSTRPDHEEHFHHEVRILRHLEKWSYSPKILWINHKKRTIYMTYCGPNPKPSAKLTRSLSLLMAELREKWGLTRLNDRGTVTDHIDARNLCVMDDLLYIIDFGSPLWVLKDIGSEAE